MDIPNVALPLERMADGLSVADATGRDGDDLRQLERILCQRIDVASTSFDAAAVGMVTFMTDDGLTSNYTNAKPVFDAASEVMSIAIVTGKVGDTGYLTWAQILELYAAGWEICNHTRNHVDLGALSAEEVEAEVRGGLEDLESHGISAPCFVFPSHSTSNTARAVVRKYHLCARGRNDVLGVPNSDIPSPYGLVSYQIDSESVANVETQIDSAYTNKRWLIVYMHDVTVEKAATLATLVAYVQGKGMPIVTLAEGIGKLGVLVSSGDVQQAAYGGVMLMQRGNARFGKLYCSSLLRVQDVTWPDANYVEVRYYNGGIELVPLSASYHINCRDAASIRPVRTSGSSRRVMDLGLADYEWRYIFGVGIGSTYGDFTISSEDKIDVYVGNNGTTLATGILAASFRETDGCSLLRHVDVLGIATPAAPSAGHSILWTDTNGDVWIASTVGSTTKKTKIFDYATAGAW